MKRSLLLALSIFTLCLHAQVGTFCANPILITLPYSAGNNTANFEDLVDVSQGGALCGAVPVETNYLAGNEVFYSYTAAFTGKVRITLTPKFGAAGTSVFVYNGCGNLGVNCIAGKATSDSTARTFTFNVVSETTYTIVVGASAASQTFEYDLELWRADCPPVGFSQIIPGTTSVYVSWGSTTDYTEWQVAVQPAFHPYPSQGTTVYSNSYSNNNLLPGEPYKVFVRAACPDSPGDFSDWSVFPFTTMLCEQEGNCLYQFLLTDIGNNGWQGNTMDVIQNDVVVGTIGQQFTTGSQYTEVLYVCPGYPIELFWNPGGIQPTQIGVTIINSFGQTVYSKPPNTGTRNSTLYEGYVNCDEPSCNIPPTNITFTNITNSAFTINWESPGINSWDIYIVPAGSPVPTAMTVPTYPNIGVSDIFNPSFTTVLPLIPGTDYDIYIRNVCPYPTPWVAAAASTIFSCIKPSDLNVSNISQTSATLLWTNGKPTDTAWEILLVPGPDLPPAPYVPVPADGIFFQVGSPSPFTITGLDPATIYYYYIRTNCGVETSPWAGPIKFNTETCAAGDKCLYKFILTDTAGDGWNGAKMQVRQNGIFVYELLMTSGTTVTREVPLCTGVPFDVLWTLEGSQPQQVGLSIQNPYFDVLHTSVAGTNQPGTVLYSGVVNCTDSPCAKPTNVLISNLTPTSTVVTWTDNSIPQSIGFDAYLITAGGNPPGNNPPSPPTHTMVSMPFHLTGLTPSTSYTLYVRAVCPGGFSTWPDLWPVTFTTPPLNDECISATVLTVSETQTCSGLNSAAGNTLGATASVPILTPPLTGSGCFVNNRDVWYKFVALGSTQTISLSDILVTPASATSFRLNFSVFSGNCNALTKIGCYTSTRALLTDLVAGETYYIRVYSQTLTLGQSASFNICITSPPSNDNCAAYVTIPVNPDVLPTQSVTGNTLGATNSGPVLSGTGCGTSDDDVWFGFTATSVSHIITFSNHQPSMPGSQLHHTLFAGNCGGLVSKYCSSQFVSVATQLTPGEIYYIRAYTASLVATDSVLFTIAITTPAPVINDECLSAATLTANEDANCVVTTSGSLAGATVSPGDTLCPGVEDDDIWYMFSATSTRHSITIENIQGTTALNCALYSGTCDGLVSMGCGTTGITNYQMIVGQTYFYRIWSNSSQPVNSSFEVCLKSLSSCETAIPFCGSGPDDPYIFSNTTGVPDNTQVACLGSIPNPTYYTLKVQESGDIVYSIIQNDIFDTYGNPQGNNRDVDFVAWGPFSSEQSCSAISMTDCPPCPSTNVNNQFYPYGNIVDCSYSPSYIETLTIPNAQAGQYYIVVVTNFSNLPGQIKLTQTNFAQPGAGTTYCRDKIHLISFIDTNNNGVKDIAEQKFVYGNFIYQKNDIGPLISVSGPQGVYGIYDETSSVSYDFSYQIHPEFQPYFTATPTTYENLTIPAGSGTQTVFFPVTPTNLVYNDLSVNIMPAMAPRPGITYINKITYKNLGLTPISATISFTKDPSVTISTTGSGFTALPTGFSYTVVNLAPQETRYINVNTTVPNIPFVNIGDILHFTAAISSTITDVHPQNNSFASNQVIIGAYDPNDKSEAHGDKIDITTFTADDYLYYTIRFQNTGTYNAFDVRVEDFLDSQLDETSIRMESASHNYAMERNGNHVIWTFSNIFLPSIVQDEPNSHGYINFRIKLKPGFALGDIVENEAAIYFDTNPPIITNTVSTEVMTTLSTPAFTSAQIMLFPNPATSHVTVSLSNSTEELQTVALYDVVGKCIFRNGNLTSNETNIDVATLAKGVYLVEVTTKTQARQMKKLIVK